jgi:hypothetical protein
MASMSSLSSATAILIILSSAAGSDREDAETLLRRVIDFQDRQQELTRQYAFHEKVSTVDVDEEGARKRSKSETYLVTPGPGGEYRRLVAKNGAPLPAKEEKNEEEKFREYLDEQLRRTEAERRRATENKLKSRVERFRERLEEAIEVFQFQPLEDAELDGEPVRVFRFEPKPGYRGHSRATKILARIEGTVWIDPERNQLARLHVRFRENMKFLGGLFGRISEGSEAVAEGFCADDAVWLLDQVEVSLDARFYFLKKYRQQMSFDYFDYQKYSVETEERVGSKPRG